MGDNEKRLRWKRGLDLKIEWTERVERKKRVDRRFSLTSEASKAKIEGQAEAPLMTLKRTKWGMEEGKVHQRLSVC